jgi:hypothetical protein
VRDQLTQLPIGYEQLRSIVLEFLTGAADDPTLQFNSLKEGVADAAVRHGLHHQTGDALNVARRSTAGRTDQYVLSEKDFVRSCDIIWDLIIEGVVRPGPLDGGTQSLPHFHLSEYGRRKLKDHPESPYDPDRYLGRLKARLPDLDPAIVAYLTESLRAFRIDCLLSSTITLGCASEKAILLLLEAYTDALAAPKGDTFRKRIEGKVIKTQFDEFSKMAESHLKGLLPREIRENLDISLTSIFAKLRVHRNAAGHPTGQVLDREQAYAHLMVFPHYMETVYALLRWLGDHKPLT